MAEKDTRELSVQGVKRLPYYLKYLKELEASNTPYVPAAASPASRAWASACMG